MTILPLWELSSWLYQHHSYPLFLFLSSLWWAVFPSAHPHSFIHPTNHLISDSYLNLFSVYNQRQIKSWQIRSDVFIFWVWLLFCILGLNTSESSQKAPSSPSFQSLPKPMPSTHLTNRDPLSHWTQRLLDSVPGSYLPKRTGNLGNLFSSSTSTLCSNYNTKLLIVP